MIWIVAITLFMTLLLGILFFVLFCYSVKDGQYDDTEEAKYMMFREPEDESEEKK